MLLSRPPELDPRVAREFRHLLPKHPKYKKPIIPVERKFHGLELVGMLVKMQSDYGIVLMVMPSLNL